MCVRTRVRACVCMRACVRDVFAIYDNNILPRLIMIIIKITIIYFIQIGHTDDFPSKGTRLVGLHSNHRINCEMMILRHIQLKHFLNIFQTLSPKTFSLPNRMIECS